MKVRIVKIDNKYFIEKRLFRFIKDFWIRYRKCPYNTYEQALERINLIKEERLKKKEPKCKEILRFDI